MNHPFKLNFTSIDCFQAMVTAWNCARVATTTLIIQVKGLCKGSNNNLDYTGKGTVQG